jgi:hypothetical protein
VREQAARLDLREFRPDLPALLAEARAGGALRLLLEVEPRRARGRLTGHSPSAQAFGADGAAHGATSQAVSTAIAELGVRRTAAQQARIALAGNLTAGTVNDARDARDRLTQQIQTVEHNDLAYRAIPYEADAHEVGDSTTEAFLNP